MESMTDFDIAVGIVGSREYPRLDLVTELVKKIAEKYPNALIVSGGARGVDQAAEAAALALELTVLSFRPTSEWSHPRDGRGYSNKTVCSSRKIPHEFGIWSWKNNERYSEFFRDFKSAAFSRNEDIVKASNVVCAFPLNRPGGTTNTINHAKRYLKRGDIRNLRIWECDQHSGLLLPEPQFH